NGLTKLNEYDKMILEMVEVFKTNDLDKYTKSQNSLVSEVAKVIREYTEEEIKKMIRRIEKEDEDDYQSVIDEAKIEARRIELEKYQDNA
ncbi:MAG: hypothetical protein IKP77_06465, partial [Acholeplasmatales bacterium]|nr:hypothetical protein [Acholeplasmatales bacterium]